MALIAFLGQTAKAEIKSYSTTVLLQEAGSLLKAGKLDKAKDLYLKALEQDSLNRNALKNVGYILTMSDDNQQALIYLKRAEQAGHSDGDIYNLLGSAYGSLGDTTNSLASYAQAVILTPENGAYLKNYGVALVSAGNFTEALSTLQSAFSLAPADGELSFLIGNSYAGLEKPKEALKSYRGAVELNYDTGDLRYNMGMVSESIGDFWSAEEHYGIGISRDPKNLELRQRLAVLYSRAGVYKQAVPLFKENLSRDPNFINSRFGLGICYAFQGFPDSANAELMKVQRVDKSKYETMKKMIDGATKYYKESSKESRTRPDSATTR